MNVLGDVSGKRVRIVDDMGDSLNTLINASDAFFKCGALDVEAQVTHLYATGDALKRLNRSKISSLHTTDSMAQRATVLASPLVHITSIAPILTQSIADLTTQAEPNVRFHERHLGSTDLRDRLGRYVAAMTGQSAQHHNVP
jgi:ribose-phosphate pyrophosphokinase